MSDDSIFVSRGQIHAHWVMELISSQMQIRLKLGYDVGKGFITCEKEVQSSLNSVILNQTMVADVREGLNNGRLAVMKELCELICPAHFPCHIIGLLIARNKFSDSKKTDILNKFKNCFLFAYQYQQSIVA